MKNSERAKISNYLDYIFYSFCIFILTYSLCYFYLKKSIYSIIISVFIFLIFSLLYLKKIEKFNENLKNYKTEKNFKKNCITQFLLFNEIENIIFFSKLINGENKGSYIEVPNDTFIVPLFKFAKITKDDIRQLYIDLKDKNPKTIIIFGNEYEVYEDFIVDVKIACLDKDKIFALLKKKDTFPEFKYSIVEKTKLKFKDLVNLFRNKKKAKKFAFFGLLLIAMSSIIPFSVYYRIFGICFLVFALLLRFIGKESIQTEELF